MDTKSNYQNLISILVLKFPLILFNFLLVILELQFSISNFFHLIII